MNTEKQCNNWFPVPLGTCIILCIALLLIGCGVSRQGYIPNPSNGNASSTALKLAVVELDDRNPSPHPSGSGLAMLPGILFVGLGDFSYPTSFASCLATDLRNSGLFESVDYYADWDEIAKSYTSYDVVISGDLQYDKLSFTQWTYGMSIGAMAAYFIGLPTLTIAREVAFEITAFPTKNPAKIMLRHPINSKNLG